MLGQRVLKEEIMPNQNHLVISTSELNSGMYLLRITNNGVEIKYQKLIKS